MTLIETPLYPDGSKQERVNISVFKKFLKQLSKLYRTKEVTQADLSPTINLAGQVYQELKKLNTSQEIPQFQQIYQNLRSIYLRLNAKYQKINRETSFITEKDHTSLLFAELLEMLNDIESELLQLSVHQFPQLGTD
jgi:molecular chaperone GrpE (heat shock protein)